MIAILDYDAGNLKRVRESLQTAWAGDCNNKRETGNSWS